MDLLLGQSIRMEGVSILNIDFSMSKQYQRSLLENGKPFLCVSIEGFTFGVPLR